MCVCVNSATPVTSPGPALARRRSQIYQDIMTQRGRLRVKSFQMIYRNKKWPSVPGSQRVAKEDSVSQNLEAEGAKNLWLKQRCQRNRNKRGTSMNIETLNTRTLKSEDRIEELMHELQNVNWDIIGLSEVRRKE